MFRKMRRAEKKAIPNEETIRLLQESKRGVLAVAGQDGRADRALVDAGLPAEGYLPL